VGHSEHYDALNPSIGAEHDSNLQRMDAVVGNPLRQAGPTEDVTVTVCEEVMSPVQIEVIEAKSANVQVKLGR
jgi:hypothetical protein